MFFLIRGTSNVHQRTTTKETAFHHPKEDPLKPPKFSIIQSSFSTSFHLNFRPAYGFDSWVRATDDAIAIKVTKRAILCLKQNPTSFLHSFSHRHQSHHASVESLLLQVFDTMFLFL